MPPVEAWEKVWIDPEGYPADIHAFINCTACHGGDPVDDMEAAHTDLIADPSSSPESGCATCHPNVVPHAVSSLHNTLAGYDTVLYDRSAPEHYETLEEMQVYHCNDCHASCGDCHISQPGSVGGGLLDGHMFVPQPPMSRTCTGCHGSRVKNEYYGLNEGIPGDVHLREARLACTDCHTSVEMHGEGAFSEAAHRYEGPNEPSCIGCHEDQVGVGSGIPEHEIHGTEILSCQVCHSTSYTNCTNCHVERTEDDVPFYSIEEHSIGFYLGKNTLRSAERPYRYVPVRHVPIDPDSFSFYGEDLLPNFLNRPTWTYATPHNIQRNTPQTESCTACHDNDAVFLTPDKVEEFERGGANLDVIVDGAPPFPEGYESYLEDDAAGAEAEMPAESGGGTGTGGDDDFWGSDSAPAESEDAGSDDDFWGSDSAPAGTDDAGGSDDDFWGSDSAPAETDDAGGSDEDFWGSDGLS